MYNYPCVDIFSNDVSNRPESDLIYVGGLSYERGIFNIIQSINILKVHNPNITCFFLGRFINSDFEETCRNYVISCELEKNVIFIPPVPHFEIGSWINSSKIGLALLLPIPKFLKNIPTKQFEYMICGKPVLGSLLPPIKKYVKETNSGILVNPLNLHEVCDAIELLMYDEELRTRLGLNGMNAIENKYSWDKTQNKLIDLYSKFQIR